MDELTRIDKYLAARIIQKVGKVFPYPTNIGDVDGYVIASTNPERVGTFHSAGKMLVDNNLNEIIVHQDDEYEGCKQGVSFAVRYEGYTIGGVGLTGAIEEVLPYGKALQMLTELMVESELENRRQSILLHRKNTFVEQWTRQDYMASIEEFTDKLKSYGMIPAQQYTTVVIGVKQTASPNTTSVYGEQLLSSLERKVDAVNNLFGIVDNKIVWVTSICDFANLKRVASGFQNAMEKDNISLLIGIGCAVADYQELHKSFFQANCAMAVANNSAGIAGFEEKIVDICIANVPQVFKTYCIETIFQNCTAEEIIEVCEFVDAYVASNGSLTDLSKKLHMHKNTVQYRINKILRLTNFDVRDCKDLFTLHLARGLYSALC